MLTMLLVLLDEANSSIDTTRKIVPVIAKMSYIIGCKEVTGKQCEDKAANYALPIKELYGED